MGGVGLGLYYDYRFALAIFAFLPIVGVSAAMMFLFDSKSRRQKTTSYQEANAVAEETFSGIRTVSSFGQERHQISRYFSSLILSKRIGIKFAPLKGVGMGALPACVYAMFAFGFWYGGELIQYDGWSVGEMLSCLLCVLIGTMCFSICLTNVEYFTTGVVAAEKLYHLIDRQSEIDSENLSGLPITTNFETSIEFKNLNFSYPTREKKVLNNFSLSVRSGQTVALCGDSGSGKSTVIQLLQRFYKYSSGSIKISGTSIEKFCIRDLRQQIGVVNQEPVLFNTTIRQNIKLGNPNATEDEIVSAVKQANAYDFIMRLPKGLDTMCGQQGSQMSGGQKQRIAIARVLVKSPKIILLDEATSALDTQSEAKVQNALDKLSGESRTLIVIAHRLATIRNADVIVAMKDGEVIEQGTHDELLAAKGHYFQLWTVQGLAEHVEDEKVKVQEHEQKSIAKTKPTETDFFSSTEKYEKNVFSQLMKMNSPEIWYIVCGCIGAMIAGAIEPLFSLALADFISTFSKFPLGSDELNSAIMKWSIATFGIGVIMCIAVIIEYAALGKAGEELTYRIRTKAFQSIVRQDMSFFDKPENTVGQLATQLSSDANAIQGATGTRVANVVKNFMTLATSLLIGFYFSWQIAMVAIVFIPIIGISQIILGQQLSGGGADAERLEFEQCQNIVSEGIRTNLFTKLENYFQ